MAQDLKLGLNTGYWAGGPPPGVDRGDRGGRAARLRLDLDRGGVRLRLPDAARVVGRVDRAASSSAPAIVQMSARQPAATAMAAMTMDHLSGGRFILGLGVSGPAGRRGLVRACRSRSRSRARASTSASCATSGRARARSRNDGPHYPLPLPERHRARQAAEVLDPPAARGHPDLPRRRGPEEHRAVRRAVRRLAGDAVLARATRTSTRTPLAEGFAPRGRAPHARRLRGRARPCR